MPLKESIVRFTGKVVLKTTAVLLVVGLFLVYFLVLPLTRLLLVVAPRGFLGTGRKKKDSYFREAEGYDPDLDDCLIQS